MDKVFPITIFDNFDTNTTCILVLKKTEELDDCFEASEAAAKQIISEDYTSRFLSRRYKNIYGIGIGFAKKSCVIKSLGNITEKKGS